MSQDENGSTRKRERSTRYPGRSLAESVEFARFIEEHGLDGLHATEIATALGYSNVKTNTFSARLSAARQFGLVSLKHECYALTPLARSILHPVDPAELPKLHRQALLEPPLYAELASRMAEKKVPEPAILANVLYHQHKIISSAKDTAAETFLESARFAGALAADGILRIRGDDPAVSDRSAIAPPARSESEASPRRGEAIRPSPAVRLDLRLWGPDQGKTIRVRAPETITPESFDRFLQAFRLLVRIENHDPE